MPVTIKTPAEQDKMRAAGRLAASVLDMIEPFVVPGATTDELDKRCHDFIVDELKSIPANLNYRGFPKTICTSVNHVVCHGIPGDKRLKSGDIITIDGSSGQVLKGEVAVIKPTLSGDFATVLNWADQTRRMAVRANAETAHDAKLARDFGAEGIGLSRTEHMFFEGDRIIPIREMILADTEKERRAALAKILPMLREDFIELFTIMAGRPVTIRLLDPPLHEFLPTQGDEIDALAHALGVEPSNFKKRVLDLREQNPMLGHRGVRLLLSYPEITDMQARAIFEAAAAATLKTGAGGFARGNFGRARPH